METWGHKNIRKTVKWQQIARMVSPKVKGTWPMPVLTLPEGFAAYKFFRAANEHVEIVLCFEFLRD